MKPRVMALVLWVGLGGCVFGSRPILPTESDPTLVDSGLAGGGRSDAPAFDSGTAAVFPDAAMGADVSAPGDNGPAPMADASSVKDSATFFDAGVPFEDIGAPADAPAVDRPPALDVPTEDAPGGDVPDGDVPPVDGAVLDGAVLDGAVLDGAVLDVSDAGTGFGG